MNHHRVKAINMNPMKHIRPWLRSFGKKFMKKHKFYNSINKFVCSFIVYIKNIHKRPNTTVK